MEVLAGRTGKRAFSVDTDTITAPALHEFPGALCLPRGVDQGGTLTCLVLPLARQH